MKYGRFLRFVMVAGLATGMMTKTTPAQAQETGLLTKATSAQPQETGDRHPLNMTVGVGYLDMVGNFPTKDGFMGSVKFGYDLNDWWSIEGGLFLAPVLDEQFYYHQKTDGSWEKISRLREQTGTTDPVTGELVPGTGKSSTGAYGATVDALFHFTPWKRVDPYLSVGAMTIEYFDKFRDQDQFNLGLRAGGGVIYNFNDSWSARLDYRGGIGDFNNKGTPNATYEAGVRYVFGANVAPKFVVSGGPKDSDADGLTDDEEIKLGTNPFDPDTDHDGLTDYAEVRIYHTDPLNPDSDYDGLKDGAEVNNFHTNPLLRDTDGGGVADGHEVLEDGTDPLNPADDLQLFELNIQFDYDKDVIKSVYFKDLDIIGKVLQRDPGSTARVEGHADKEKGSDKTYNDLLSERRAKACAGYLTAKWSINATRLTSVGYGFSRPKAKNDPILGNPVNRRVEVYIRKSGNPAPKVPFTKVEVNDIGAVVPVETK